MQRALRVVAMSRWLRAPILLQRIICNNVFFAPLDEQRADSDSLVTLRYDGQLSRR
jgi:hypothetical protein